MMVGMSQPANPDVHPQPPYRGPGDDELPLGPLDEHQLDGTAVDDGPVRRSDREDW